MRISDWSSDVCSSDLELALAVEGRGVEVGVAALAGQGIALDGMSLRIDADDRVEPAVGDPRRTVRSDDHAVRRRAFAERDVHRLAGLRIESAQRALVLPGAPVRPDRTRLRRETDTMGTAEAGLSLPGPHGRLPRRAHGPDNDSTQRHNQLIPHS